MTENPEPNNIVCSVNISMAQLVVENRPPQVPERQKKIQLLVDSEYKIMKITPVGYIEKTDINPVSRLNFGVETFNHPCNQIFGIQLIKVWIISPLSCLYDLVIYFYERFFLTITCQTNESGWVLLLYVAIYIALLIAPIVSPITFSISAIFFLYYCIGLIVYFVNKCRLKGHEYTERMVPKSKAPNFQGQNEYFQIQGRAIQKYIVETNQQIYYQSLIITGQTKIMAYTQQFVSNGFQYIVSCREIAFHIALIFFAIIGLIISVKLFSSVYEKK